MEKNMKKKNETATTNESKRPVHSVKIGAVRCSVFLNRNAETGKEFPSAVISRTYKSGDTFKDSNSYSLKNLSLLETVAGNAKAWIKENYPDADIE